MPPTQNRPGRPRAQAAKPTTAAPSRTVWIVVAVVVAVVLAIVVALALGGGDDDTGGTAGAGSVVNGTVEVEGAGLPISDDLGAGDPTVGRPFPTISGQDVQDGSPVVIDPDDGTPKLVIGIAHWCPHCQREVPEIQRWLTERGAPEGVELYAVSTSVDRSRGNYPPAAWLDGVGWQVPTVADDLQLTAATAIGLTSFPYFVAVDGEGNVVKRASGELSIDQIEALLEAARTSTPR